MPEYKIPKLNQGVRQNVQEKLCLKHILAVSISRKNKKNAS